MQISFCLWKCISDFLTTLMNTLWAPIWIFKGPSDQFLFSNLIGNQIKSRTVFENHRKCLIQHCERSELRLHFEWKKCQFWRVFEKLKLAVKQCYQTSQFQVDKNKVWIFTPKLFCSLHMIFCYAVAHAKNQLDFWHTKSRKQIRCVVENKKMHELLN